MIDSTIVVALIITLPNALLGYFNLLQSRKNGKSTAEVHLAIDGRMDELLQISKEQANAAGLKQGREEER